MALVEIKEGRYFIGVWFVGNGKRDWMCSAWRDPGEGDVRQAAFRFRYYADRNPWDSKDKKNAYSMSCETTEAHMEQVTHRLAELVSFQFGEIQFAPMHSDNAKHNLDVLSRQPWAHMRQVTVH